VDEAGLKISPSLRHVSPRWRPERPSGTESHSAPSDSIQGRPSLACAIEPTLTYSGLYMDIEGPQDSLMGLVHYGMHV
jgi:hypothetical protein